MIRLFLNDCILPMRLQTSRVYSICVLTLAWPGRLLSLCPLSICSTNPIRRSSSAEKNRQKRKGETHRDRDFCASDLLSRFFFLFEILVMLLRYPLLPWFRRRSKFSAGNKKIFMLFFPTKLLLQYIPNLDDETGLASYWEENEAILIAPISNPSPSAL